MIISNIPQQVPLRLKQGSTLTFTAVYKLPNGNPDSLTNEIVRLRVRKKPTSTTDILVLDNDTNGGITLQSGAGTDDEAVVLITAVQSAGIDLGEYFYDYERDNGGTITPTMSGSFEVKGQV